MDKLDVADISDLKKHFKRPFFDGLSYEELRASLSLPPIESVFKKITNKEYSSCVRGSHWCTHF